MLVKAARYRGEGESEAASAVLISRRDSTACDLWGSNTPNYDVSPPRQTSDVDTLIKQPFTKIAPIYAWKRQQKYYPLLPNEYKNETKTVSNWYGRNSRPNSVNYLGLLERLSYVIMVYSQPLIKIHVLKITLKCVYSNQKGQFNYKPAGNYLKEYGQWYNRLRCQVSKNWIESHLIIKKYLGIPFAFLIYLITCNYYFLLINLHSLFGAVLYFPHLIFTSEAICWIGKGWYIKQNRYVLYNYYHLGLTDITGNNYSFIRPVYMRIKGRFS